MADWGARELLILAGLCFKATGFLIRDELLLRLFVVAGIACDLTYYALSGPGLPPSALSNAVLIVINLGVLTRILFERTTIAMTPREKRLFHALGNLTPGQFRRLARLGRFEIAAADTVILTEGEATGNLYFVEEGQYLVGRGARHVAVAGPAFLGEIAFLRGAPASATVTLPVGTAYVVWPVDRLRPALARKTALRNALISRLASDMARKLADSMPDAAESAGT